METPLAILIAKSDHTAALRQRVGSDSSIEVFPDSESLRALDSIVRSRPKVVALDKTFVNTARGAALVARVKTDTDLASIDVRVLIEDETKLPLLLVGSGAIDGSLVKASRPVDRCGTRRATRIAMNRAPVTVNGERSQLVDLSVTGAQVIVPVRLRPTQPLRLTLVDGRLEMRCQGLVAWSVAMPVGSTIQYRAGMEFVNPDTPALEAFCEQHRSHRDRSFGAG